MNIFLHHLKCGRMKVAREAMRGRCSCTFNHRIFTSNRRVHLRNYPENREIYGNKNSLKWEILKHVHRARQKKLVRLTQKKMVRLVSGREEIIYVAHRRLIRLSVC
jgi:hypothetical protein